MKGLLITFEGVDGGGKSLQASMLASACSQRGLDVVQTWEPGGSRIGQQLRELILGCQYDIHKFTELFLFMADRAEHVAEIIMPAIERGAVVICDRYVRSTEVYQGMVKQTAPLEVVQQLNTLATQGVKPDIELLIDCPVKTIIRRMDKRGEKSKYDKMSMDFHEKIRTSYLEVATRDNHIHIIDGDQDPDDVFRQIWSFVHDYQEFRDLARYEGL